MATTTTSVGPPPTRPQSKWGFRWLSSHYPTGDIYQDDFQELWRREWGVKQPGRYPYLEFVREISSEWPHLRRLADFMEIGTIPTRWQDYYGVDRNNAYTYPIDFKGRGSSTISWPYKA